MGCLAVVFPWFDVIKLDCVNLTLEIELQISIFTYTSYEIFYSDFCFHFFGRAMDPFLLVDTLNYLLHL